MTAIAEPLVVDTCSTKRHIYRPTYIVSPNIRRTPSPETDKAIEISHSRDSFHQEMLIHKP